MRDSLLHAREAGQLLQEAKAKLARGTFLPWVRRYCSFSPRTAELYMLIAREWEAIDANAKYVASLGVGAVARWLTVRKTDSKPPRPGHAPEFWKNFDQLRGRIGGFLQPNRLEHRHLSLITSLNRSELHAVRDDFEALRGRVDEAIALVDRQITGEIDEAEQRRVLALLEEIDVAPTTTPC